MLTGNAECLLAKLKVTLELYGVGGSEVEYDCVLWLTSSTVPNPTLNEPCEVL